MHLRFASERANAAINNKAIFESAKNCRDPVIAQAVYDATVAERDKGWLQGPIDFESLPPGAVLTRRFGVEQTSFDVNVGSVKKVRPIDDYTESLVNHTNSSSETINPHGIDTILAAAAYRVRRGRKLGLRESLAAKTVDLRKAYKQLYPLLRFRMHSYASLIRPPTALRSLDPAYCPSGLELLSTIFVGLAKRCIG